MATDRVPLGHIPSPLLDRVLGDVEGALGDVIGPDGVKIDTKVSVDASAFDPVGWVQENPGKTAGGAAAGGVLLYLAWRALR